MRAGLGIAEDAHEALLHLRRHRVLDALRFLVGLPPLVAEKVDEHPLGEAVPADDGVGQPLSALGQMHFFTSIQQNKAISL